MDKPWKVIFAFVGVFIAGAVFGGLFTLRASGKRLASAGGPGRPNQQVQRPGGAIQGQPKGQIAGKAQNSIGPAMMRQYTQQLKLTEEQRAKIRPIVARAAEDLQRLRRENLQDTTRVMERMYIDIEDWLQPAQRAELEEMKRAMQERVRVERLKRGDPPAGDGTSRGSQVRPKQGTQSQGSRNDGPTGQAPANQPRSGNP